MSIAKHQSAKMLKDEWLTPPYIIKDLGPFDLDPCSPVKRPWDTALKHFTMFDNGLNQNWAGMVWLCPPYGKETGKWLARLADHGNGIALVFARTETEFFFNEIWDKATGVFFLKGRLFFHHANGTKAAANSGAPNVLVAYGKEAENRIRESILNGMYIPLR